MSMRLNFAILVLTIPFSFAMGLLAGVSIISFEHSEAWREFAESECYPYALVHSDPNKFEWSCSLL